MASTSTLAIESQQTDAPASHLRRAYEAQRMLFQAQPEALQRFLEKQSLSLSQALVHGSVQIRFSLPEQVWCEGENAGDLKLIPINQRLHRVGGLRVFLKRSALSAALNTRLATLEASRDRGVASGASLVRFTTATMLIREILRAARELASPNVAEARRIYMPQWVAFDEQGKLLVNTIGEARAHIAALQAYLGILRTATSLAPYIVADAEYQQIRYGMMGQLANQGRALARYETDEIIRAIQRRVQNHSLNRGLSLSLPYFDDQDMELKDLDFEIIPSGRVLFVPAFLVLAVSTEEIRVAHNEWMSASTRQHLLVELKSLKRAFDARE
jgi:hypothetical protein